MSLKPSIMLSRTASVKQMWPKASTPKMTVKNSIFIARGDLSWRGIFNQVSYHCTSATGRRLFETHADIPQWINMIIMETSASSAAMEKCTPYSLDTRPQHGQMPSFAWNNILGGPTVRAELNYMAWAEINVFVSFGGMARSWLSLASISFMRCFWVHRRFLRKQWGQFCFYGCYRAIKTRLFSYCVSILSYFQQIWQSGWCRCFFCCWCHAKTNCFLGVFVVAYSVFQQSGNLVGSVVF